MIQEESKEFKLQEIREYKVVKSNDLIQHTRFILTALEQKIILYLISKIKPPDIVFEEHEFQIREFCEVCKSEKESGANYKNLKNALKSLRDKSIWLKLPAGSQTTISWFSRVTINDKSGTVIIKFDDLMKPLLLQLKEKFTQFSVYYILAMRSLYSIRLYEILKSYENMGGWKFEVEELKTRLCAEKYTLYGDFKRRVIDTAVREINDYGDISVTYAVEKRGKKITHVNFHVRPKKDVYERLETWEKIDGALGARKRGAGVGP